MRLSFIFRTENMQNKTKTEYEDKIEAPEENNFIFSVLINTPNIQQNAFKD